MVILAHGTQQHLGKNLAIYVCKTNELPTKKQNGI
jgi:hypothetical protein